MTVDGLEGPQQAREAQWCPLWCPFALERDPPSCRERLPHGPLIGPLIAPGDRVHRLPASQLALVLERRIFDFRGEEASKRMPASAGNSLEPGTPRNGTYPGRLNRPTRSDHLCPTPMLQY